MSRIGKLPIKLPQGVEIKLNGALAKVKGPKGELQRSLNENMKIKVDEGEIRVIRPNDERQNRSLHGLTRTLINNMVIGVTEGYSKTLNVVGVGYKVELKGKNLVLQLGFSHPINFPVPEGIEFQVDSKKNTIFVKGIDKEKVGQTSADIRKFRPPEPYKGKGVMYADERIKRKAGKAAVGTGV
ncbi:MAG: 50S ribosomal protein L6 [Nitrospinota bacterium]|nr:50S ribosomal protein L6 [Nitrospinota bacterium]